jgi:hypothetical protein
MSDFLRYDDFRDLGNGLAYRQDGEKIWERFIRSEDAIAMAHELTYS